MADVRTIRRAGPAAAAARRRRGRIRWAWTSSGRDLLARLLAGARVSLFVGCAVVGVSALVGIAIGSIAGYLGGKVDAIIGRLMDVLLAFPGILLAIALVAVLGPSLRNVVLALVTIGWVGYARLVRGQVLKVRELEYVQSARALGAPLARVLAESRDSGHVLRGQRPGHARHGRRHHRGGFPQFSRARRSTADAELGDDAGCGAGAFVRRAAPDLVPGAAIALLVLGLQFLSATRSATGSIRGAIVQGPTRTIRRICRDSLQSAASRGSAASARAIRSRALARRR